MAVVPFFNHPVAATLLLALALLSLLVELRADGFGRAGWAGLMALGLFVASHLAGGTPAWTVVPVAAGVAVLWPALRDPTRRILAWAGIATVAGGAYAVLVGPGPAALDHARAFAVLVAALLLAVLVSTVAWWRRPASERPPRRTGVFFFLPPPRFDGTASRSGLLGARGRAGSALDPGGWAVVEGRRLEVVSEGEWLGEGEDVEVIGQEGVRLRVRRARAREGDVADGVDAGRLPG